jgi:two-component system KDP operon response regulator KdpE
MSGPRLLLVEDEAPARKTIAAYLRKRDYEVDEAADAAEALRSWDGGRPDAILLDLGLPDLDGIDVIRRVRREAATPIIVLSARGEERDRIAGLDAGADDYLSKPFSIDELNARIRAVLRRSGGAEVSPDGCLRLGPIELDPLQRTVRVGPDPLPLTPREYELLKVLLSNQGRLVTRERLLRAVWGLAYTEAREYVHVYMGRLRRKIAAVAGKGIAERLFVTETGVGYRVADEESLAGD